MRQQTTPQFPRIATRTKLERTHARGLVIALVAASTLGSLEAAAEIYRTVKPDGSVTYSDTPSPGQKSTPVKVEPANGYASERQPYNGEPGDADPAAAAGVGYTGVAITAPTPDATFHSNEGIVPIGFQIQPPLRAGDAVQVLLDGVQFPISTSASGEGQLRNVERGAHTLVVQVLDASGAPAVSSDPVVFYLQKTSVLLGPNANPNGPARRPAGAVLTPPKRN